MISNYKNKANPNDRIRVLFNTLILIVVFVLPYTIMATIDIAYKQYFDFLLVLCYIMVAFYLNIKLFRRQYLNVFLFSLAFSLFGVFNQIFNGYLSVFNVIAPFAAYFGYVFTIEYKLSSKLFNILMIGNYIYFYNAFYSKNAFGLFVDESELIVDFFVNTSENLIPTVLIFNLFIYDVLNFVKFNKSNDKYILVFAFINFVLILVQRGRAGVIVSLVFLLIKLFDYNRKLFWSFFALIPIFITIVYSKIMLYIELAGGVSESSGYIEDVRGQAMQLFFSNMTTVKTFFFGYGKDIIKIAPTSAQALFLNIWNYQGLVFLLIVISLFLKRIIYRNKRMVPVVCFIPFFIYSLFEGFFLPGYWDFVIYLILFYKTNAPPPKLQDFKLKSSLIGKV